MLVILLPIISSSYLVIALISSLASGSINSTTSLRWSSSSSSRTSIASSASIVSMISASFSGSIFSATSPISSAYNKTSPADSLPRILNNSSRSLGSISSLKSAISFSWYWSNFSFFSASDRFDFNISSSSLIISSLSILNSPFPKHKSILPHKK